MRTYPLDARSTIENYREQLSGTVSADHATCSPNSFELIQHSMELKKKESALSKILEHIQKF